MKKLLLSVGVVSLAIAANAQSLKRTSNNRIVATEKKQSNGSTKQVTGSLACNTYYVAGSTMDLSFTLNLTNADGEYCDLLSITFPAGITPNSTQNDPLIPQPINPAATGTQFNAISGQTVSWGTDDDANQYGGIPTGVDINFTVNVTIAAGTTGNLTATFVADGDTWINQGQTTTAADLSGNVTIFDNSIQNPNFKVLAVRPLHNIPLDRTCGVQKDTLMAVVTNVGNTTESSLNVNFSINGASVGQAVALEISNPSAPSVIVAPGDTVYALLPDVDVSAAERKDLTASVSVVGDVFTANDQITESYINSATISLTNTNYTNGIESSFDVESLNSIPDANGIGFGTSTGTKHSGNQALFYTTNMTTIGAPAGTYETFIILPCTDVVAGETYKVSYWRKANSSTSLTINGSTSILVGLDQDQASLSTIKSYTAITPNAGTTSAWSKDSVEYIATNSETVYFAIGAQGTVSTGNGVNVRIDDILIEKLQTSGVNENTIATTVYPNPVNDVLNIKANGVVTNVTVSTLDGKIVKSVATSTVNVSDLTAGMYIYQVTSNGKVSTGNFVKN